MASWLNRGENVFFQFRNGKSVLNSQCKPRMFKTAEKATLGVNYIDTDDVVEYAEVKHGRWEQIGVYANCTNCGTVFEARPTTHFFQMNNKFCRMCGARMDGE